MKRRSLSENAANLTQPFESSYQTSIKTRYKLLTLEIYKVQIINFRNILGLRVHSLFMTGGGLAKFN